MTSSGNGKTNLSLGDSIGLLALVFAIFAFLVDPTPTVKLALILGACGCTVIFIWISHWTYRLPTIAKTLCSGIVIGSLWTGTLARITNQIPGLKPTLALGARLRADAHTPTARLFEAGTLGALLTLVALAIFGAFIVRWNARRSDAAPQKGFLDYKLEAEQAIQAFPSRLEPITTIVTNVGKLMEAHTARIAESQVSDTGSYLKKLRRFARELDSDTKKLARPCERLRSTALAYSEGLTGWTDWMKTRPGYTPAKQQFVSVTHEFIKSTISGVAHMNVYLDRLSLMRGVSKDLNYSVDRHIDRIASIRDVISGVTDSSLLATGKLIPGYEQPRISSEGDD
jgi:hypothetical protein